MLKGKDILMSGTTGHAYETYIFTGPVYYQNLHHQVYEKIRYSGKSAKNFLTRQPMKTEGSARIGEMERSCLISNGTR